MTTELYNAWTERLTEFTPTSRILSVVKNKERTYCCLGVACELSNIGVWESRAYVIDGAPHLIALPQPVKEALNLATNNGMFNINDLSKPLKNKLNKALKDQNDYTIYDSETTSLASINDTLQNDPSVFTLIQAILKEAPVSLFKKEETENERKLPIRDGAYFKIKAAMETDDIYRAISMLQ